MNKIYNNIKTVFLLGGMAALIMGVGSFWGQQGLVIAFVFAIATTFFSYFFSDKIAVMSMGGQEVGPGHELYDIVQRLAGRARLPMPRVYVSPQAAPNAFATGRGPNHASVCATQGLLDMLTRDEVAGVMGHELAHVKHRDILIQTIAVTLASVISFMGYNAMFSRRDSEGNPLVAIALIFLGPIAAGLIQMAISRSREFNADTAGAEIAGDPMALATALEKIHAASARIPMDVNPAFNSMFIAEPTSLLSKASKLFQTHPPLEARLQNLIGRTSTGRSRFGL